jgi:hypothetical protein
MSEGGTVTRVIPTNFLHRGAGLDDFSSVFNFEFWEPGSGWEGLTNNRTMFFVPRNLSYCGRQMIMHIYSF